MTRLSHKTFFEPLFFYGRPQARNTTKISLYCNSSGAQPRDVTNNVSTLKWVLGTTTSRVSCWRIDHPSWAKQERLMSLRCGKGAMHLYCGIAPDSTRIYTDEDISTYVPPLLILLFPVCHSTMRNMSFNVDQSWTFSEMWRNQGNLYSITMRFVFVFWIRRANATMWVRGGTTTVVSDLYEVLEAPLQNYEEVISEVLGFCNNLR